uniref:HDC15098 n=1 Tax=Drosophila melanogaster TaxID=7227 RepID=Q6IJD8_DROME|nr:TPA_inf: HDC15098 [Drosophila melanogaster]
MEHGERRRRQVMKRRRRHHQTLLLTRPRAFDGKLKANSPKVALYLRLAQMELIKWQQQIIASRLSGSYLWLARGISE